MRNWHGRKSGIQSPVTARPDGRIKITSRPYLNPAKLRNGLTIGAAFVAGTYPPTDGNAVSATTPTYNVNSSPVAGSYVLQEGDVVHPAAITLSATGAANRDIFAEPSLTDPNPDAEDFTFTVPLDADLPAIATPIPDQADSVSNGPFVISYAGRYTGDSVAVELYHGDIEFVVVDDTAKTVTIAAVEMTATIILQISNQYGVVFDEFAVAYTATNTPPVASSPPASVIVVPAGSSPVMASSVPSNGGGIDLDGDFVGTFGDGILLGATGTVSWYDITGDAVFYTYDVATDEGTGAGKIEISDTDELTLHHPVADFIDGRDYGLIWDAGFITNLGGIPITGNANPALLAFTAAVASGVGPSNTVAPVLSGSAVSGQTLSVTNGTWTGDPTITYTYQWQRSDDGSTGWANIGSATASSYLLAVADEGKYIRCQVTGTNATDSATANSNVSSQIAAPAGMVLVGRASASGASANLSIDLTALSGGIDTEPASGDLIKVWAALSSSANEDMSIDALNSETYVDLAEVYANDTRDINMGYAERFSDGTETAVITPGSGSSTRGAVGYAEVWRSVNATPQDVAATSTGGPNSALANPPSITPTTPGARVFAAYAATQPASTSATPTGPGNMSDFNYVASAQAGHSVVLGVASEPWTADAFDPDPWTGVTESTSESWAGITSAQKPA